jgi:hypothetical protein
MGHQVLEGVQAMISRTIWYRQCPLIENDHETGGITLRRQIQASVRSSRCDYDERASCDESGAYIIDMIDDLVICPDARLLA